LLISNGRLEADLLDELTERLSATAPVRSQTSALAANSEESFTDEQPHTADPTRTFPGQNGTISSTLKDLIPVPPPAGELTESPTKHEPSLQAEAENLAEILKNTTRPKNLIAVRKSGTPVVSSPSLSAKSLFLASMHDEFELLDFNPHWVHVRISGLSRGWIWRDSVEMPEGIPDTPASSAAAPNAAADLFHAVREEVAPFPGDWEPLRGKNVNIISVQQIDQGKSAGVSERLEYAKSLLEKSYSEIAEKKHEVAGIVVIFDSADGGMIAATASALQQWRAGTLTDSALWHKCFFDPPEILDSGGSSGTK
jgi:hypothetical protein